ncbi:MAG: hypothetical protein ACRDZ8_21110 [Acidimicrobiales bacterium]
MVLAASVGLWGSLHTAWFVTRVASHAEAMSAMQLSAVTAPLTFLMIAIVAGVLIEGLLMGRWPLIVATVGGAIMALAIALSILLSGFLSQLVSPSFVPPTIRRYAFNVHTRPGAWLALVLSLFITLASHVTDQASRLLHRPMYLTYPSRPFSFAAAVASAGIAAALVWDRNQPWLEGSVFGHHGWLPASVLPVIGIVTLLAVGSIAVTTMLFVMGRDLAGGLTAALSGWVVSLAAGVDILGGSSLALFDVRRVLGSRGHQFDVGLRPGWGSWIGFAAGCALATTGVVLVAEHEQGHGPGARP